MQQIGHGGMGTVYLAERADDDETRLIFDNVPGAVRFLGTPVALESLIPDADDTDGELDVVIADLTTTQVLSEGLLLEVDLRLLEPGAATIEYGVTFSTEPPASFGDVEGRSVPGTAPCRRKAVDRLEQAMISGAEALLSPATGHSPDRRLLGRIQGPFSQKAPSSTAQASFRRSGRLSNSRQHRFAARRAGQLLEASSRESTGRSADGSV